MRLSGPTPLTDWFVLTVRWVFLAGVGLWLAFEVKPDVLLIVLIVAAMMGNLAATLLVASNHRFPGFRFIYLIIDLVFAQLAFFLGRTAIDLAWVGLLPLITAALYFSWPGAAGAAVVNALAQGGLYYLLMGDPVKSGTLAGGVLVANLLVGAAWIYGVRRFAPGQLASKSGWAAADGVKKDRERRGTIFEMISALSATLNYERVLDTALSLSAETLSELNIPQVEKMVGAVLLFSDAEGRNPALCLAASHNFSPTDQGLELPGVSGLVAHTIDEGQPELTRQLNSDAELSKVLSLQLCRSAYCLPLRSGLDAYGLLLFAHPDPDFFAPERREVLDIVARQAIVAIQNARLYRDLEQEKNRMAEIQEESRKKLARDLHDGPTQSISAIAMRVNFARRLMDRDLKAAAEELYKIEELARRTTKEIRHMLFTLRPLVLESQGLEAALQSMADKMGETFSQNVIIQVDGRVTEELEANKQAIVFYIAEEAVNNARKHAKAEHIWVRVKLLRDHMSLLEVEDDGVGFDVNSVSSGYDSRGSLGMINLRERTDLVNGVLRIDSAKGRGTRVQVVIPLTEEAADRIHRVA